MAGSGVAATYFKIHLQNLAGETDEHHSLSLCVWIPGWKSNRNVPSVRANYSNAIFHVRSC